MAATLKLPPHPLLLPREICAFEMLGRDEIRFYKNQPMLSEVILGVTGTFCRDYLWAQQCQAEDENTVSVDMSLFFIAVEAE